MIERKAQSVRGAQSQREAAKSGQHPAVQEYRAKLESIEEGAGGAASKLDQDLEEFRAKLKTPVPHTAPEPETR